MGHNFCNVIDVRNATRAGEPLCELLPWEDEWEKERSGGKDMSGGEDVSRGKICVGGRYEWEEDMRRGKI